VVDVDDVDDVPDVADVADVLFAMGMEACVISPRRWPRLKTCRKRKWKSSIFFDGSTAFSTA